MDSLLTNSISISASFDRELSAFERRFALIGIFPFQKLFHKYVERLYIYIIKKITGQLDNTILILNGAKEVVKSYDADFARRELKNITNLIDKFAKIEARCSKENYMGSDEIRIRMLQCLTSFYDIEFILRKKAFDNQPHSKTDDDFLNALSSKSKSAIRSSL